MTTITKLIARPILDSRGNPTLEADFELSGGCLGRGCVPSGASTGVREALELRDNDAARYQGKGVKKAIANIQDVIAPALVGKKWMGQALLDEQLLALDNSSNKSNLGANALLAVSLAAAKANAALQQKPLYTCLDDNRQSYSLPTPMMNIINGGAHADNNLDIQEFMIIPAGATSFSEALRYGVEVFHTLKQLLKQAKCSTAVGDEGGFAPQLDSHEQAMEMICEAITKAGFSPGKEIYLGLDMASSEFYRQGRYHLGQEQYEVAEWVDVMANWAQHYPLLSIEDGMAEDDWQGWALLTQKLGQGVQLVGDDLFVTNKKILSEGINEGIANAILIKPNQIGTLTETLAAITTAQNANYGTVISHRSGETEDTTIADLAVGTAAGQIKTGSLCRSDRVAKYNQLLRIEEALGSEAQYAGMTPYTLFRDSE